VTRLVERLERKGLARRQPSLESRREVSVTATAAGETLIEQVMDRRRTFISEALVRIPRRRRLAMLTAFREFAEAVGEPLEIDQTAIRTVDRRLSGPPNEDRAGRPM
jgi:DNA-binding MarR family transcriptional regulator